MCAGITPHAPCTMNCIRKPPTRISGRLGANIHSGMISTPSKDRRHHRAAPPKAIGEMSERESTEDRADHRERGEIRGSMRAESFLLLQIRRVHILRAVRDKIHHGHEHDR